MQPLKTLSTLFLLGALTVPSLYANVSGTLIEQRRQENVDNYIQRLDYLFTSILKYVNSTGDGTPTRAEVQAYFDIPNDKFTNFLKEECVVSGDYCGDVGGVTIDLTGGKLSLGNVLTGANADTQRLFNTSLYLEPNHVISSDFSTMHINLPSATQSIIDMVEDVNTDPNKELVDSVADLPMPGAEGVQYYVPDGNGGMDIYAWDPNTGEYRKLGTVGGDSDSGDSTAASNGCTGMLIFTATDPFDVDTTPGTLGLCAKVESDEKFHYYTHNGTKWIKDAAEGTGGGGLYDGTGTIQAMATDMFDSAGGSTVTASAPNGEFGGSVDFNKKDDFTTGGYWTNETSQYIVTKDIDALSSLSDLFVNGTTAWIDNGSGGIYKLIKEDIAGAGVTSAWVYRVDTLDQIFTLNSAGSVGNDGAYAYVVSQAKFYSYANNIWTSVDGLQQVSNSASGRDVFMSLSSGVAYFINISDCATETCNGAGGTYAGVTTDNLYAYYYAPTAIKTKNNLTDAIPVGGVGEAYTDGGAAYLISGGDGDVPAGGVILKNATQVNGDDCYVYNGNFVTQAAVVVSDHLGNNLLDRTCVGANMATFTGAGVDQKINTTNLLQFVNVVPSSLIGYKVQQNGDGITSPLKYCEDSGAETYSPGKKVWSDDCVNIATTASYAITDGSREDLPAPSDSSRVNLTLNTGTEPNYTGTPENNYKDGGVQYADNASFKQWFYSLTGTTTQNMLDAIIPTATYATTNGNGSFGYTAGVTPNAYLDTTAKDVGYAFLNNIVAHYNGTFWRRLDNNNILSGDFVSDWTDVDLGSNPGVSGNGLLYTGTNAPFNTTYTPQSEFGVTTWSVAECNFINPRGNSSNICESRGMVLPTYSETQISSTSIYNPCGGKGNVGGTGVPSHPSGLMWTSTASSYRPNLYWNWNGASSGSNNGYGTHHYVRCVR